MMTDATMLQSLARTGAAIRLEEVKTEIAMLTQFLNGHQPPQTPPVRSRHWTPAQKAKMSRAAKARWRAHRAKHGRTRLR